jgi:hypothetical protein
MAARSHATLAAAVLLALALSTGLAGCASPSTGNLPDSHLSFDRTFDITLAAMADQRLTFSEQDRRQGRIVGTVDGSTVVATVRPIPDGTNRVSIEPQGEGPEVIALAARVSDAYRERMAKLGILGGFNRSNDRGPVPCPSGPAFCP